MLKKARVLLLDTVDFIIKSVALWKDLRNSSKSTTRIRQLWYLEDTKLLQKKN